MSKALAGVVLALATAILSGCASVEMADTAADTSAKSFAAPQGKAGVYIFRNETFGAAIKLNVTMDGKDLGQTASKTYFYEEVAPGQHTVVGRAENESRVTFDAVAGKLYYIWQEVKMGLLQARNQLQLVDEATGRAGVLESKRIATAK
jgi:uncharacterized protein YceK